MSESINPTERIILPLDVTTLDEARELIDLLHPFVGAFKVGYELGYRVGWHEAAELITQSRAKVFLDAKLDDIPRTVAAGVKALSQLNPWIINVHASSGKEALKVAIANKGNSLIFGVTVLTSIDEPESKHIFGSAPGQKVVEFALDCQQAGLDGLICSPQELLKLGGYEQLRSMIKVIPGVRPSWSSQNDQKRTMTPAEAVRAGADYLVIGRPILQPPTEVGDPLSAVKRIIKELEEV